MGLPRRRSCQSCSRIHRIISYVCTFLNFILLFILIELDYNKSLMNGNGVGVGVGADWESDAHS